MREYLSELDSALPLGRKGIFMLTFTGNTTEYPGKKRLAQGNRMSLVSMLNVK